MFNTNEITSLVQRINMMMGNNAQKKITFIAARPQEGTSTVARRFAETMAEQAHIKVLLIDAGNLDRARFITDGIDPAHGIAGSYTDGGKATDAIHKIDYNLYLGRWQGENDASNAGNKAFYDSALWSSLQKEFPVIVLDAPSLQGSSEGIALAATADATVLIVDAETAPPPIIDNLRGTLESAGAKVVSTLINNRRVYVPEKTYGQG